MSSIAKNDFHAALNRLESMAKGQGASQLHHTASDSDVGQHAGTSTKDYQDEHTDGISDNGTDYDGVKKALAAKVEKSQALTPAEVAIVKGQDPRRLIADKVSKGLPLTPAESWAVKGGFAKIAKGNDKPTKAGTPGEASDAGSVPDSHAGDKETEIEHDAKKSLDAALAKSQYASRGLEMSPILAEFASALGHALRGVEQGVAKSIANAFAPVVERVSNLESQLAKSISEQGAFNSAFAETMVGIGQHVAGGAEVASAYAQTPAYAPKSQLRAVPGVQPIEKSFGPGGLETGGQAMAKSQIVDVMSDLVQKGQLSSLEVCKYEMTGEISPNVQQLVLGAAQGRGQ